ncbi:MAG: SDR family NAD(P)-dependent oxidoreductase, partial [Ignavibacteria bacterium]
TLHASGSIEKCNEGSNAVDIKKIKSGFRDEIPGQKFYDDVQEIGIEYRDNFQGIQKLFVKQNAALARIVLKDSVSKNYKLHPALLDAGFQTALSFLLKDKKDRAFIPIGINEFIFNGRPESKVLSFAELNAKDIKNTGLHNVDIKIFSEAGEIIALVKGLQLKEVSREEFSAANDEIKDWFYEVTWESSELNGDGFIDGSAIADVGSDIESNFDILTPENNLEDYKKEIDELEAAGVSFIINAFIKSGFSFEKGKTFTVEEIRKTLGADKKYFKLLNRLLEILFKNGIIKIDKNNFKILKDIDPDNIESEITGLKNKKPLFAKAENELLLSCGPELSNILTGKQDPLKLLFPNGDLSFTTELYQNSPGFAAMNETIQLAVEKILISIPESKTVRVLEIGAGSGSTSALILPLLKSRRSEFVFTDISPAFFVNAKERFKEYSFVNYKVLDIERSITEQGFDKNGYDIIIASNVIHATKDLQITTKNIHELLSGGGVLILNEVTEKKCWIDLTFGLTDGWWRFEDNKLRTSYPLLDINGWKNFLTINGFTNIHICSPASKKGSLTGQSIIISTADKNVNFKNENVFVIFSDKKSSGDIAKAFGKINYISVVTGKKFERVSGKEYVIDHLQKQDYEKLFKDISAGNKDRVDIIYISPSGRSISSKDIVENAQDGCLDVLNIIQTISKSELAGRVSLSIVTFNAQQVKGDDELNGLAQSVLWGMRKVIDLEMPELKSKVIDMDDQTGLNKLLDESDQSGENQIAYRNGKRFVSRLIKNSAKQVNDLNVNDKSTYLITGGLGGLGILTAKWLADKGAKHLALLGRRDDTRAIKQYLEELKLQDVDVNIYKADVTKKEELEKIIKEISNGKFPLKGIIHSAGVLDDGVLINQSKDKFEKVMAPKVLGAWNLHELTKKMKLDLFIMYSSVASLLGSAGQANHSAANSFLDSLAHYRRHKGLPALSINWGVWSEIGSAAAKGADKQEKISGIGVITPQLGIRALDTAVTIDTVQIGIVPIDWNKYSKDVRNCFVEHLIKQNDTEDNVENKNNDKEDFISQLKAAPEDKQPELLIIYFQDLISRIMGMEPEDMDPEQPLNTMGLDSLMAIELKNKVNIELGVDLNLVRYMEETNIIQLADELKEQLPKILDKKEAGSSSQNGKTVVTDEDKTRDLLGNLENLTEEELDRLLNETK